MARAGVPKTDVIGDVISAESRSYDAPAPAPALELQLQLPSSADVKGGNMIWYETNEYTSCWHGSYPSLVCYQATVAHAAAMPLEQLDIEPVAPKARQIDRLSFKGLCAHAVDRTVECLDEHACMLAILRVMLASSMFRAWSRWKSQARSTCSDSRAASTLSTAGGTTRKIGTCRGHRPLRRVQCGHEAFADRRAIGLFGALEANLSPLLAADGGCPPFRIP